MKKTIYRLLNKLWKALTDDSNFLRNYEHRGVVDMNGLVNEGLIRKAWLFLRENECTIPSETLDFMRDVSIRELDRIEKETRAVHEECTWTIGDSGDMWSGSCGVLWYFFDARPMENNMCFCPQCGKKIVIGKPPEAKD